MMNQQLIIKDKNEYWNYLYGGKNWDNSKYGLLKFIYDCIVEIYKR